MKLVLIALLFAALLSPALCSGADTVTNQFPKPLSSYSHADESSMFGMLRERAEQEPFNVIAFVIFLLAIIHTFLAPMFTRWSHELEVQHRAHQGTGADQGASFKAQVFHFMGEVEAIFGIWVVPLLIAITLAKGWNSAKAYFSTGLNFTEPLFVVVIMAIAASRPVLRAAEQLMAMLAGLGGGTAAAWWLTILTAAPVLGSFITEPAAMTIGALLLARKFYERKPSAKFAYATLGLLFVNVSVGGTLTHFAAPPVLMVASKWGWGLSHMLMEFGWKALVGIGVANILYFAYFRKEFKNLATGATSDGDALDTWENRNTPIPIWITVVHIAFLGWTVANSHYPELFVGGFLFFLAFSEATEHHQNTMQLRRPLLVGFFLAGLVVHGGLQGWWLEPVLSRLEPLPLLIGSCILTAFNDNAAITYLASLVPGFGPELKYAVVAGAVAGGGLTVIANAPNPAGQSILSEYFPDGVSPLKLFLGALVPTLIMLLCFALLR